MLPKITVIIPTYNRASVLARAIGSVLEQSFQDFELIIIDDGSTDATQEVLAGFSKLPNVKSHLIPNAGVSAARNTGIEMAKGEWVAFLDSDDEWLPSKLSLQMSFAEKHSGVRIIHGEEIWIRNGVRVNPMKKHQKKGGDVFAESVKLCCISPSAVIIKRSLFTEVGLFREDYPVCEDYDLWLKISVLYEVGYIEDFLIKKYGGHSDQLSRKFFAMDYWRIKSLQSILKNSELSNEKREMAQGVLVQKRSVLLKGYRKHQNLSDYNEVFNSLPL